MKKGRLRKQIVEKLGLPSESLLNSLRIVVLSDCCYVENHKGILKYTKNEIKIKLSDRACHICGSDLCIVHIHLKDIKIGGQINFISLEEV